jgi:predicted unusual protein kinase regulating ubiquinone biosynthesis (AarF/ABC1/UbiB family)
LAEAILAGDNLGIADGFHRLGFRTRHDRPDTYRMLAGVFLGNLVTRGKSYTDEQFVVEFITDLPRTLRNNPLVAVPADILFLFRTMGLLNGLARSLDSRVDLRKTLLTYSAAGIARAAREESLDSVD